MGEQIYLSTGIEIAFDDEYNCHSCLTKFSGRPSEDEHVKKVQKMKFCGEISPREIKKIEHFSFTKCIGNFKHDTVSNWIDLFMKYEKQSILPFEGGMAQQPYKVIQLFQIIESIRDQKLKEKESGGSTKDRINKKLMNKRATDGQ